MKSKAALRHEAERHGVSFPQPVAAIDKADILNDKPNPSRPGQRIMILHIGDKADEDPGIVLQRSILGVKMLNITMRDRWY